MFNPGAIYGAFVVARWLAGKKGGKKAPPKGPSREEASVWKVLALAAGYIVSFILIIGLLIGTGFVIAYAAATLFVTARDGDVYFSANQAGFLCVPALAATFYAYEALNRLATIHFDRYTRSAKTLQYLLLQNTLQKRRKWTPIWMGIVVLSSTLIAEAHVRVTQEEFCTQPVYQVWERRRPLSSVRELTYYRGFKDSKGKIVQQPSAEIGFADGSKWNSQDWGVVLDYSYAKEIMKFVGEKTSLRYTVKELRS